MIKAVPTAQKDVKEPVKKTPQPAVVKGTPFHATTLPRLPLSPSYCFKIYFIDQIEYKFVLIFSVPLTYSCPAAPKAAEPKQTAPALKKAAPAKTEVTAVTSEKKPVTQKLAEKKPAAVKPAEKKPVEKVSPAPKLELTAKKAVAPKKGGPSPATPAAKEV